MLKGIASAVECTLQSLAVIDVACNFFLPAMDFIHYGLEFFHRKSRLGNQIALLVEPGAMGHVDLDPIHPVIQLLAGRLAGLDGTVNDLDPFGQGAFNFRGIAFERIPAGSRDGPARSKDAGTGNISLFYGSLDIDITVSCAFSFHIANGGKTLLQSAARRNRGTGGAVGQSILQELHVITAFGGVLSLQKNVSVG